MDEITKSITSPIWLFSTIFAALIVNIGSAYTKPIIDKVISKYSAAWRTRTEKKKRELENDINKLVSSSMALAGASEDEVRFRLQAIHSFLFSLLQILFLIMNLVLGVNNFWDRVFLYSCLIMSIYTMTWSLSRYASASRVSYMIQVARHRLIRETEQ